MTTTRMISISTDTPDQDDIKYQELQVLKSIYFDNFIIDDDEQDGFYKIKINVQVPEEFKIRIIHNQIDNESNTSTTSTTSTTTTTTTEQMNDDEYSIVCLPNITLGFEYPNDYPSSPPLLMISCCWLSLEEMNLILKELDLMWEKGEPIIFRYVDWIKSNLLTFLQTIGSIRDGGLILSSDTIDHESPLCQRIIWEHQDGWTSPMSSLPLLLAHNSHESKRLFSLESHTCPVCYNDEQGDSFELLNCNHFICKQCLVQFLTINIQSGSLNLINCSEPGCKHTIDQNLIAKYSSPELFDRYKSIMKMSQGFIECKRCKGWAKVDQQSRSTFCGICYYSMCMMCQEPWHPGTTCHGASNRIKQSELETERDIKRNCRPCPGCSISIWKFDGCNKVVCTNCSKIFCWLCLRIIDGYEHFQNNCVLFEIPGEMRNRRIQGFNHRFEGVVTATVSCCRCRGRIYQYSNNNHLFCFQCKGEMCFLCHTPIQGTKHFTQTQCSQHGGSPVNK